MRENGCEKYGLSSLLLQWITSVCKRLHKEEIARIEYQERLWSVKAVKSVERYSSGVLYAVFTFAKYNPPFNLLS